MFIEPWKGESFDTQCLKILVLGESSYTKPHRFGEGLQLDWNRRIISEFLRTGDDKTIQPATDVLLNAPTPAHHQRVEFWRSAAFANFVQKNMGEPKNRPKRPDLLEGQPAFKEYIELLQPRLVLVFGCLTYDYLPGRADLEYGFRPQPDWPSPRHGRRPWLLYINTTTGCKTLVCCIPHPRRPVNFDPRTWRPWVQRAIHEASYLWAESAVRCFCTGNTAFAPLARPLWSTERLVRCIEANPKSVAATLHRAEELHSSCVNLRRELRGGTRPS